VGQSVLRAGACFGAEFGYVVGKLWGGLKIELYLQSDQSDQVHGELLAVLAWRAVGCRPVHYASCQATHPLGAMPPHRNGNFRAYTKGKREFSEADRLRCRVAELCYPFLSHRLDTMFF
jgi:hypothetical protein